MIRTKLAYHDCFIHWLSARGRVVDLRSRCPWFEPYRVIFVFLSKTLYPDLSVLVSTKEIIQTWLNFAMLWRKTAIQTSIAAFGTNSYLWLSTPIDLRNWSVEKDRKTNMVISIFVGWYFHFYSNFSRIFFMQTVDTLIRRRVLRRLIWVCTVSICPTKVQVGVSSQNFNFIHISLSWTEMSPLMSILIW